MNAMIFAAGLGTRLRPYTDDRPKALVEIDGHPLLEIVLNRLQSAGFRRVVVNVHHYADQVEDFLKNYVSGEMRVLVSDERDLLLDTGGGLAHAFDLFEPGPILLHNVDIISNLDLAAFWHHHQQQSDALATLAVRNRSTSRYLVFDSEDQLCGWENAKTGEQRWSRAYSEGYNRAFSGIHIVERGLFKYFPQGKSVFSIIDVYLEAAQTEIIRAYLHDEDQWLDVGKPQSLAQAKVLFKEDPYFRSLLQNLKN